MAGSSAARCSSFGLLSSGQSSTTETCEEAQCMSYNALPRLCPTRGILVLVLWTTHLVDASPSDHLPGFHHV